MARRKAKKDSVEAVAPAGGRQAWLRAGAGLSLIAVLLVALTFVDRGAEEKAVAVADAPAVSAGKEAPEPNIVTTPREPLISSAVALPATEEAIPALLEESPAPSDAPAATPESSATPEIAPPAARQSDEPPPSAKMVASTEAANAPRLVLRSAPAEPDGAPVDAVSVAPAATADKKAAAAPRGYLLQLGVFGQSANAQALYEKLRGQGLPARLETRVVAGPFATRKSAEAARERLARAGMARGLVVSEK